MTVRDLIDELEQYDDDQNVCVKDSGSYLNSISIVTEKSLNSFYGKNKSGIVTIILGRQLGMATDNVEEDDGDEDI